MEFLRLLLWVVFCVGFVTSQRARPVLVLSTIVVLRVLVPSTASGLFVGDWAGSAALHPATVLMGAIAAFGTMGRLRRTDVVPQRWVAWYAALGAVALLFVAQAVVMSGPTSLLGLTNAVLAPMVLFVLVRVVERREPGSLRRVLVVFVAAMTFVALLVVLQAATRSGLPWSLVHSAFVPDPGSTFRPRGTFDSPLDLGFAAAVTIPLTLVVRREGVRIGVVFVLLGAVVLSASRIPTALAAVVALWVLARSVRNLSAFVAATTAVLTAAWAALCTGALDGLVGRINGSDGNSASERSRAARYAYEHLFDHVFMGGGWGAAWRLKGTMLRTSLENSYAILAFDLGLVPVVILVLVLLVLLVRRSVAFGGRPALASAVVLGFCYSGLVTMSAASTVLWLAAAACAGSTDPATPRERRAGSVDPARPRERGAPERGESDPCRSTRAVTGPRSVV